MGRYVGRLISARRAFNSSAVTLCRPMNAIAVSVKESIDVVQDFDTAHVLPPLRVPLLGVGLVLGAYRCQRFVFGASFAGCGE